MRWENGTIVRVSESGLAIEDGDRFECRPEPALSREIDPREIDPSTVLAAVASIRERVQSVAIERLIVTHGFAEHECQGRLWSEEAERFHLSIVRGPLRAIIDAPTGRLDDIAPIAAALSRAGTAERAAPDHLRLAPIVSAALLPFLTGQVVQTAGGLDGYGVPIVEAHGEPWPNWYRPSYRMRPVRMPLNVRIDAHSGEIDGDLPLAVALLEAPQGSEARMLIVDGERVYPSTVRVARVTAVAAGRIWYPYGGGSFGAEMML